MKGELMIGTLDYRGYSGSVDFSVEDNCLYGKVLGIKSLLLYEGESVTALKADFEDLINEYLEECESKGIAPEKPYKGSFNIRVGSELHKSLDSEARAKGCSMNALIKDIIERHYAQ